MLDQTSDNMGTSHAQSAFVHSSQKDVNSLCGGEQCVTTRNHCQSHGAGDINGRG